MGLLRTKLEKVKEEKEGFEFKIAKFEKSSKDLDDLSANLSYSGHEEFKQPEIKIRKKSFSILLIMLGKKNLNKLERIMMLQYEDWVSDDEEE
ncbi:hypothetical protein Tco_0182139, partial [Tanacetum coccineum]